MPRKAAAENFQEEFMAILSSASSSSQRPATAIFQFPSGAEVFAHQVQAFALTVGLVFEDQRAVSTLFEAQAREGAKANRRFTGLS